MSDSNKFEQLGLNDNVLRGIFANGWENPSKIQWTGIPAVISGRDVVLQAPSGQGKTGTYAIGMLQRIRENEPTIQGIVILNTRELADQVYRVCMMLGSHMLVNFVKCVGRIHVNNNLQFPNNSTVLIGTPGKIIDVLKRNDINQQVALDLLVIDEFDKTLETDFIPQVKDIFRYVNEKTNIILSSATINEAVLDISKHFMRNPIQLTIPEECISLEGIRHFHVVLPNERDKFEVILDLYKALKVAQSVIFVNSKRKCDILEARFRENDFTISSIHGGMDQKERDIIMNDFRSGRIRILLSTDLTARGIDVPSVNLVINYELPYDNAQYIHRVGRTGRYGKHGFAINLISGKEELQRMNDIEKCYQVAIPELPHNFANIITGTN